MRDRDLQHVGAESASMRRRHGAERGERPETVPLNGQAKRPDEGQHERARRWLDVWAVVEQDAGNPGFVTIDAVMDPPRSPMKLYERVGTIMVDPATSAPYEVDRFRPILDPITGIQVEIDPIVSRTTRALAPAMAIHASVQLALGSGVACVHRRIACLALYPRDGKYSALGIDLEALGSRVYRGQAAIEEARRRDGLESALPLDRWELERLVFRRLADRHGFVGREADDYVRLLKGAHLQVIRHVMRGGSVK